MKSLLTRNVEEVIVKEDLEKRLKSNDKLRLYFGIDPTSPKLHLGHAVVLWKLKDFQDAGHEVILLIGDFTARIGDPSDKQAERQPLSEKQIKSNFKDYKKQASKILDFSKVKIKNNSKWLKKLRFADILNLASKFTAQQMLERDMFKKRINSGKPISVQEFLYPLMQGYDSVAMDVDLEVAGTDQTFNMLAGRTLQKALNNKDKHILTLRLLVGIDGRKMSKSFGNVINLDDEPNDMYGKIMSLKDDLMSEYFELATRLSLDEIKNILKQEPRDAKARLAFEIVKLYYGEEKANQAGKEFNKVFRDKKIPDNIPEFKVKSRDLVDMLLETKMASSKNEARRLIEQGGVKFENNILRVGKRRFARIV